MKKHNALALVIALILTLVTALGGAASDREARHHLASTAQPAREICYVDGKFHLTAAEGLRRIGSWTGATSASDECPADSATILSPEEGLRRVGNWAAK